MKDWKDVYQLPLSLDKTADWVYDERRNFVFQFEVEELQDHILDVINGVCPSDIPNNVYHLNGEIRSGNITLIIIRGWGNLTGSGAMNLSDEEASNIQDTFAQFIVDKLNNKY